VAKTPALDRQRFIEAHLDWKGTLSRTVLCQRFGICDMHASGDISTYKNQVKEKGGENLIYDTSAKTYKRHDPFVHIYPPTSIKEACALGVAIQEEEIKLPYKPSNQNTLAAIHRAISTQIGLEILYASVNSGEIKWRTIFPHHLVWDGTRHHTRAYCPLNKRFVDFATPRILDWKTLTTPRPIEADPHNDTAWNTPIQIPLCINPNMPKAILSALEHEYNADPQGHIFVTTKSAFQKAVELKLGIRPFEVQHLQRLPHA
jgi:hypothetical protein